MAQPPQSSARRPPGKRRRVFPRLPRAADRAAVAAPLAEDSAARLAAEQRRAAERMIAAHQADPPRDIPPPAARLLPQSAAPPLSAAEADRRLAHLLLRSRRLDSPQLQQALDRSARGEARLAEILQANALLPEAEAVLLEAQIWGWPRIVAADLHPDPRLIAALGAERCLRDGLLPLRRGAAGTAAGTVTTGTVIVTSRPDRFARHAPDLIARLGPITPALATEAEIRTRILTLAEPGLRHRAETRVALQDSCRAWSGAGLRRAAPLCLLALLIAACLWPAALLLVLLLWALVSLLCTTGLKLAAVLSGLRARRPGTPPPVIARLPHVSVIVPLYRERHIAQRLIRRLSRIDYPRELLQILLAVEAEDDTTRRALSETKLPPWISPVLVPAGGTKTKPRALCFALPCCRGSIIGIYDAEDAPAPDQIRQVVTRFHARDARLGCVQGWLDFYNPRQSWIARCFALEYGSWFRLILPGLERLGLPIPLGGTTLFLRRSVLEEVGAWDALNVTEDADLGIRLARHGYRTEILATTTEEEAACHPRSWIRQRSRWLKGYMMTWAVHMRAPRLLWRQLGPSGFLAVQILFLGTISQFLLAPLYAALWIWPLALSGTIPVPGWMMTVAIACFAAAQGVNLTLAIWSSWRPGRRGLIFWSPLLAPYFALASLAAYKALWELVARPFYWDKTTHGLPPDPRRASHPSRDRPAQRV